MNCFDFTNAQLDYWSKLLEIRNEAKKQLFEMLNVFESKKNEI